MSLGALDSQNRDVPRYTGIIFKFPVLVQADHSAQTVLPSPNRASDRIGRTLDGGPEAALVFGLPRNIPAFESSAQSGGLNRLRDAKPHTCPSITLRKQTRNKHHHRIMPVCYYKSTTFNNIIGCCSTKKHELLLIKAKLGLLLCISY